MRRRQFKEEIDASNYCIVGTTIKLSTCVGVRVSSWPKIDFLYIER